MSEYKNLTAKQMADGVKCGELSAVELTKEAINLAKTEGKELNAFITICEEKALKQAAAVDALVKKGTSSPSQPLAGVPVAIKDNISYTDYATTCASHILDGYIPPYDATCVKNLIDAGAIIIGKTNMDEFAMGSSNENSFYGPVKNPVNHELVPGGSSGGSTAAVAQKIVPIAFGSETGGSVRQPAALCGVFGLKPTYGGISRYGLVAFASSTDQIAPLARTAEDIALAYQVAAGRDENDSTSVTFDHPLYSEKLATDKKFKIGIPKEYFAEGLNDEVKQIVEEAIKLLEKNGHTFKEISLPMTNRAIAVYYIITSAEASSNLARFDGVKYGLREAGDKDLTTMYSTTRDSGFGAEVKRRIMLGTYVLSAGYYEAYYRKASKVRELIRLDFEKAFNEVDLIISPTSPTPAFKLGEKIDDPLTMYLSDIYTASASLAGNPGISVPFGKTKDGLPIGVQFLAPWFNELSLFQISNILQKSAS